jgi:PIN domain nuclease of toxin-antitoxin system
MRNSVRQARRLIEDVANTKLISPAVYWELAIKISISQEITQLESLQLPEAADSFSSLVNSGNDICAVL